MSNYVDASELIVVVLHGRRYALLNQPVTIAPGQSAKLKILTKTGFSGRRAGKLQILSNAANHPVFRLTIDSTVP